MPQPGKTPSSMFKRLGYNCRKVKKLCDCDKHCPPGKGRIVVRTSSFNRKYGKGTEVDTWVDSGFGTWYGYARMQRTTPAGAFVPRVDTPDPVKELYNHPEDYEDAYCCCRK